MARALSTYPARLPSRLRLGVALMVIAAAGHTIGLWGPLLEHVADSTWPAHARFHAFQGLWLVTGWDIAAVLVALGPFRRGERWALGVLLVYLGFAQLGYFIAMAVVPTGLPPGLAVHLLYLSGTIVFVAGLVLSRWRLPHDPPAPR
jgi:hypothetical protein